MPRHARGRLHPEPEAPTRSPWQRDRDRIIHSSAFRKLQYKTQVFVNHEGDFYRTRLTHSIEVAQIARSIARALGLDEDLTEALALAHDLGHPPFGHAGEDALNLAMKPFGGFDHNAQSLRVVTLLESRYAGWDGLNLTWETLEGLVKHNGPLRNPPAYIADYNERHRLELAYPRQRRGAGGGAGRRRCLSQPRSGRRAAGAAVRVRTTSPICRWSARRWRRRGMSSLDVPPPRLRHETHPAGDRRDGHRSDRGNAAAAGEAGAAGRRCGAPREAAGGRVQPADGGGEPGDQGFPVRTDVSPLAGQPDDRRRRGG